MATVVECFDPPSVRRRPERAAPSPDVARVEAHRGKPLPAYKQRRLVVAVERARDDDEVLMHLLGHAIGNRQAGGKLAIRLIVRDGPLCAWCGVNVAHKDVKATVDHVIPRARGGTPRDLAGLVLACKPCNNERGDMDARAWLGVCLSRGYDIQTPVLLAALKRVGLRERAQPTLGARLRRRDARPPARSGRHPLLPLDSTLRLGLRCAIDKAVRAEIGEQELDKLERAYRYQIQREWRRRNRQQAVAA